MQLCNNFDLFDLMNKYNLIFHFLKQQNHKLMIFTCVQWLKFCNVQQRLYQKNKKNIFGWHKISTHPVYQTQHRVCLPKQRVFFLDRRLELYSKKNLIFPKANIKYRSTILTFESLWSPENGQASSRFNFLPKTAGSRWVNENKAVFVMLIVFDLFQPSEDFVRNVMGEFSVLTWNILCRFNLISSFTLKKMRHLRLICASVRSCSNLRRVQLWIFPRTMCDLRWSGNQWCLLLQRVYDTGERSRWMPENCESRQFKDRLVLRAEKVWIQAEISAVNLTLL